MYSKLPPNFGNTPVKVVFEGVEPGSPEAQKLFHQHQGQIQHFHKKARQNRDISQQPGASMQQAMPAGGQMRYTYNLGQETVHVRLAPTKVVEGVSEDKDKPRKFDVVLAIDVLFDTKPYVAADVTSYEEEVVSPGSPGSPGAAFPAYSTIFDDGPPPPNEQELYFRVYGDLVDQTTSYTTSPSGFALLSSLGPTIPTESVSEVDFIMAWGSIYFNTTLGGYVASVSAHYLVPGAPVAVPPTERVVHKHYVRHEYEYIEGLIAVGLAVGEPGTDGAYSVKSVGVELGDPDIDSRLQTLAGGDAVRTITRRITIEEPEPRVSGAGFAARPKTPQGEGFEIDVWMGSCNVTKKNAYPDGEGSTVEEDDPSFEYDATTGVDWTIRLREFVDVTPHRFHVETETEQRVTTWLPPPAESGGGEEEEEPDPDAEVEREHDVAPTERQEPPEISDMNLWFDWGFAAAEAWEDTGEGDPTDAQATGSKLLGNLLAERAGHSEVAKCDVTDRALLTEARWNLEFDEMTKVATIKWTPGTQTGGGTAKIIPA